MNDTVVSIKGTVSTPFVQGMKDPVRPFTVLPRAF